jgi:hypothetical protein
MLMLYCLSLCLVANTHAYHHIIGSSTARDQGALGTQHSPSRIETNSPSLEQVKHQLHNLLLDFALQSSLYAMVVHLCI